MEASRRTQALAAKMSIAVFFSPSNAAKRFNDSIATLLLIAVALIGCRPEDSLIFHPSAEIVQTPRQAGLQFQDHFFTSVDGVRLHGWFIPHHDARATLVWFHGNAGNISHRVENIKLLHDKVKINIFIFDYRGYGRSAGSISEEGVYRDGAAALDFVRQELAVEAKSLIIFGRSLGAAVAAEMALRFACRGLILETPFTSIRDMAKTVFPVLPIGPFLRTRFDVLEKITHVKVPLLVLHGDRDDLVPYEQGQKVFAAARGPKEFYTINGAKHNDTYLVGGDAYFERLRSFVEAAPLTQP
jgi:fermentation-respiration switch protein FrsA (DUF1100 family)